MIDGQSEFPAEKAAGDEVTGGTTDAPGHFASGRRGWVRRRRSSHRSCGSSRRRRRRRPIQRLVGPRPSLDVFRAVVFAEVAFSTRSVWLVSARPRLSYAPLRVRRCADIACPCALGLATPTAKLWLAPAAAPPAASRSRARRPSRRRRRIDVVAFDKTGTLHRRPATGRRLSELCGIREDEDDPGLVRERRRESKTSRSRPRWSSSAKQRRASRFPSQARSRRCPGRAYTRRSMGTTSELAMRRSRARTALPSSAMGFLHAAPGKRPHGPCRDHRIRPASCTRHTPKAAARDDGESCGAPAFGPCLQYPAMRAASQRRSRADPRHRRGPRIQPTARRRSVAELAAGRRVAMVSEFGVNDARPRARHSE